MYGDAAISFAGHIGTEPVLRTTSSGLPMLTFRVCVQGSRQGGKGEPAVRGKTSWFVVTAWRSLAETAAGQLRKGTHVLVIGTLAEHNWETKDGLARTDMQVAASYLGLSLQFPQRPRTASEGDPLSDLLDAS